MEPGREQEDDAQLVETFLEQLGLDLDNNAQTVEDIGAARPPRRGPVAVLGDSHPAGGQHDRRSG